MVDLKKMEENFIAERDARGLNTHLLSFTYKEGKGAMVIDMEAFNKLPKAKQAKILKLMGDK